MDMESLFSLEGTEAAIYRFYIKKISESFRKIYEKIPVVKLTFNKIAS